MVLCIMKEEGKRMINNIKVEICCGCIDDVKTAAQFDIDRIELNSALELGGLTPTLSTLQMAKKITNLPICCMVRTRGAGFIYSELQIENMMLDAKLLLESGADGIVFGFIDEDHTIDVENTKKMVQLIHSYHADAVFHKAFDACKNLEVALQQLIDCGVDRVLTQGGKCLIEKGAKVIGELFSKYGNQIELLPGGGITPKNILDIANTTKSGQVHFTAKMTYHDDGDYIMVGKERIAEFIQSLKKAS